MPKTITGGNHKDQMMALTQPTIIEGGDFRNAHITTDGYTLVLRGGDFRGLEIDGYRGIGGFPKNVKVEEPPHGPWFIFEPEEENKAEEEPHDDGTYICVSCELIPLMYSGQIERRYRATFDNSHLNQPPRNGRFLTIEGNPDPFVPGLVYILYANVHPKDNEAEVKRMAI